MKLACQSGSPQCQCGSAMPTLRVRMPGRLTGRRCHREPIERQTKQSVARLKPNKLTFNILRIGTLSLIACSKHAWLWRCLPQDLRRCTPNVKDNPTSLLGPISGFKSAVPHMYFNSAFSAYLKFWPSIVFSRFHGISGPWISNPTLLRHIFLFIFNYLYTLRNLRNWPLLKCGHHWIVLVDFRPLQLLPKSSETGIEPDLNGSLKSKFEDLLLGPTILPLEPQ